MFERYAESARRALFYSRYMANQLGCVEIETEHLLLGLLRADIGLARRFFGSPWAAEDLWREIEREASACARATRDLPLSSQASHALTLAAEEADYFSSKTICTEHLLLGLLGDERCRAAQLLHARGMRLAPTRDELNRSPHDDSASEHFIRDARLLPKDVVESQLRIQTIVGRMQQAIATHDFAEARVCSDEEHTERDALRLLYKKYDLSGWLFE